MIFAYNSSTSWGSRRALCRASQRSDHRRRGDGAETRRHRAVAWPPHTQRGRHLHGSRQSGSQGAGAALGVLPATRRSARCSWQGGARRCPCTASCRAWRTRARACSRTCPRLPGDCYHSLIVDRAGFPGPQVTAETGDCDGPAPPTLPIHGVQFNPESIASEHGHKILRIS